MGQIIKKFSDFHSINEAGIMDYFSDLIGSAGTALTDVAKGKVIDYLMDFLGIEDKESIGAYFVRNLVEQIDLAEYPKIVFGNGIPLRDFAPKLAKATNETIVDLGIDGIATRFKITDKKGWIYRTINEMVANRINRPDFIKTLTEMWTTLLGGSSSNTQATFTFDKLKGATSSMGSAGTPTSNSSTGSAATSSSNSSTGSAATPSSNSSTGLNGLMDYIKSLGGTNPSGQMATTGQ